MKHICAWCKKEISPSEEKQPTSSPFFKGEIDEEKITHGICRECADVVLADAKAASLNRKAFTGSRLISGQ